MSTGRRVLYLTADGLLQPLGYSQVVRVVEGLARRGFAYDIASLERPKDLARADVKHALEVQLAAVGVRWFPEVYDTAGGGRAASSNLSRLSWLALRRAVTGDYVLSHARSYFGASPALAIAAARRIPFLFDARGYWVDERLEEGRWFTNPVALRAGRAVERRLFASAAAVVTLTELQAEDVRGGAFGPAGTRPIEAIPTCADFDEFQIRRPETWRFVPADLRARLEGRLVVGFVGAMNRSYLSPAAARLAKLVLDRRPDAFVVALSGQRTEYSELFARYGIAPDRSLIQPVDHRAMSEWLSLIRWGLLLLDSPHAKRGSMPTKLAEFFAAGVRPLQHGCNTEVSSWVDRAGSGYVLADVTETELARAAEFVCSAGDLDGALLVTARKTTESHFSLASGIDRYARIIEGLAPGAFSSVAGRISRHIQPATHESVHPAGHEERT